MPIGTYVHVKIDECITLYLSETCFHHLFFYDYIKKVLLNTLVSIPAQILYRPLLPSV